MIGCDGRHSTTRRAAQFEVIERGVPIDVLWFHISRHTNDPEQLLGNINYGRVLILINRGDYFQAGLVIRKGSLPEIQSQGLDRFRQIIRQIAPYLGDRVDELQDWEQIKLLTVQINRLRQWYRPGLLCIGDAAHAMSPAGGVGINLAIQDAVATANLLADPLREGRITEYWLAQVQLRREFPTRVTQQIQSSPTRGSRRYLRIPVWRGRPGNLRPRCRYLEYSMCWHGWLGWVFGRNTSKAHESASGLCIKNIAVGVGVAMGVAALAVGLLRRQRRRAAA